LNFQYVLVRISKLKRKFEIIFLLKTSNSGRAFRKIYGRLKNADHINKKAAILIRENEKFAVENKILRREIEDLRKAIFKEKRKKKRRKALNFHKKDKMEDQIFIFQSRESCSGARTCSRVRKSRNSTIRIAANRKMQQAIAREEKAREAAEKKARREIERIAAREKAAREKIIKAAEREAKKA
jgi:hypothetical protein